MSLQIYIIAVITCSVPVLSSKGDNSTFLEVRYNKVPNILFVGHVISAQCLSCSRGGTDEGSTHWAISTTDTLEVISDTDAQVQTETVSPSQRCPGEERSVLTMKVTLKLNKAVLVCYRGTSLRKGACHSDRDVSCHSSLPLDVRHGPHKPTMTLKADRRIGALREQDTITVSCQVCVAEAREEEEDVGARHIFWGIWLVDVIIPVHNFGVTVMERHEVILDKKTWDTGQDGRRYKNCGKVVVSSLKLRADMTIQGGKILCFPYNFSDASYDFGYSWPNMSSSSDVLWISGPGGSGMSFKKRNNNFKVDHLAYMGGFLLILTVGYQMVRMSASNISSYNGSYGSVLGDQDDLWNTEPEISKVMSTNSDAKFHGVIKGISGRNYEIEESSMYVHVTSSILLNTGTSAGRYGTEV